MQRVQHRMNSCIYPRQGVPSTLHPYNPRCRPPRPLPFARELAGSLMQAFEACSAKEQTLKKVESLGDDPKGSSTLDRRHREMAEPAPSSAFADSRTRRGPPKRFYTHLRCIFLALFNLAVSLYLHIDSHSRLSRPPCPQPQSQKERDTTSCGGGMVSLKRTVITDDPSKL